MKTFSEYKTQKAHEAVAAQNFSKRKVVYYCDACAKHNNLAIDIEQHLTICHICHCMEWCSIVNAYVTDYDDMKPAPSQDLKEFSRKAEWT